jgi:NAD-dependent deacetylase
MDSIPKNISSEFRQVIKTAAGLIQSFGNGVVLTGAGISTPSGIPDFRTPGSGLWSRYDPMEMASLSAFRYNPEKFFSWFHPMAMKIVQALPNPAHHALAVLEKAGFLHSIITQNIDGLHQRAGSKQVFEVHGSMQSLTCISCFKKYSADSFITQYIESKETPRCPSCEQILKPDMILYEEQLPQQVWLNARNACRNCSLILVAGSSLEVTPAATLPLEALENNAKLIIINQSATYLDPRAEVLLKGDVADILPQISAEVLND